ncbi:hypothetical protein DICPUDRAFT_151710 [Dictyostelium purpureum]|uniref:protein O-GlcNAc transferase n=1 Tax=Dictyostelium purpureum TaxID=5786 RepID=F0ZJK5_DICPU|nr:uncharacterized protein DICPUDRAFT_151710 [Dictyostelium purpureum]EGC35878.1 hypothetical protein DICPUDRAFT_151710 [Dictyostelium purpureum]|eukprot:XP_003287609.1 hypothetical protein DICPUDRAFT_151710 [Dictyostelium purpureum]
MSHYKNSNSIGGSVNNSNVINNEKVDVIRGLLMNKSEEVLRGNKEIQAIHFKRLLDLSLELLVSSPSNQEYRDLRALSLFSFVNTCLPPNDIAIKQLELANQLAPNIDFIKNRLETLKNDNSKSNSVSSNGNLDKIKISNKFFQLSKEYQKSGDLQLGFQYLKTAYENNQDNSELNLNLSNLYEKQGKFQMSIDLLNRILKKEPFHWEAHYNLAALEHKNSLTEKAIKRLKLIINSNSASENQKHKSHLLLLFYMNFVERYNCDQDKGKSIYEEHLKYYNDKLLKRHHNTIKALQFSKEEIAKYSKQSPIKIAYLSNHFHQHPIAYFIMGLLESHNRQLFDIHIIQIDNGGQDDNFTKRIRGFIKNEKNWIKIPESLISEYPHLLSQSIREKEISIAVSLDMHTEKHAELLVNRIAPIQINYLGYPNSSGIDPSILQYRITDEHADPITTEQPFTETLIRLPKTFLNFDPSHLPPVHQNIKCPFETNGFITFGCYNTLSKIQPCTLTLWKRIQDKLPTCKILIKSPLFILESSCNDYLGTLKDEYHFDISRVILKPYSFDTNSHYLSYSDMDISLDTFPYNGTTTSFDSLYMGVPFITLSGPTHVHSVGKSILNNIPSLSDLIAATNDQYADIAVSLASSPDRLKYLRNNLRSLLSNSPLSNSKQFTLNFEKVYKEIHSKLNNK